MNEYIRSKSRIRNLIHEISALAQLDPFNPSRKREFVETRSLLYTVLKTYYRFNLREITDLCAENDYHITHASVIHSLNCFDIYRKYNKNLDDWYNVVVLDLEEDISAGRIDFIKPKLKYLSEDDLLKLSTTVKEMYEEAIIQMRDESLQT